MLLYKYGFLLNKMKYFLIKIISAIANTASNNSPAHDDLGIKSNFLAIA